MKTMKFNVKWRKIVSVAFFLFLYKMKNRFRESFSENFSSFSNSKTITTKTSIKRRIFLYFSNISIFKSTFRSSSVLKFLCFLLSTNTQKKIVNYWKISLSRLKQKFDSKKSFKFNEVQGISSSTLGSTQLHNSRNLSVSPPSCP